MALQKLSRDEIARLIGGKGGRRGNEEYIAFMRTLRMGEGGKAVVAEEGVSRQSVKNRITAAADVAGVAIKYHHSAAEEVIFEVVEGNGAPRRRGRKPKAEAGAA